MRYFSSGHVILQSFPDSSEPLATILTLITIFNTMISHISAITPPPAAGCCQIFPQKSCSSGSDSSSGTVASRQPPVFAAFSTGR